MSKDSTDELFDIKTAFYIGDFPKVINEAQKLRVKFKQKRERNQHNQTKF